VSLIAGRQSAVEEGEGEDEGLDPFIPEGDESDDSLMDAGEKQPPKKKAGPSKFFERKVRTVGRFSKRHWASWWIDEAVHTQTGQAEPCRPAGGAGCE
jgi:hypothetical protein